MSDSATKKLEIRDGFVAVKEAARYDIYEIRHASSRQCAAPNLLREPELQK
jgi:hypothetical protein